MNPFKEQQGAEVQLLVQGLKAGLKREPRGRAATRTHGEKSGLEGEEFPANPPPPQVTTLDPETDAHLEKKDEFFSRLVPQSEQLP